MRETMYVPSQPERRTEETVFWSQGLQSQQEVDGGMDFPREQESSAGSS